jgi:20S proteasome alpha/beta subunit
MTVQIGMIGTDGVVLASDTRHTRSPLFECDAKRYGFASSKIGISDDGRIAATRAMNMRYAAHAACSIISGVQNDVHSRDVYADYADKIDGLGAAACLDFDVECIVAFADPEPSMYRFRSSKSETDIRCRKILDKVPAGDVSNSAVFWSERYYSRIPVSKLIRLAAHLIISAGELNNGSIEGLEIVYCDSSTHVFRRYTEAQNRDLMTEVKKRGKRIGNLILGHSALS